MHFLANWEFWLAFVTAGTACASMILTLKQSKLSNKQHLFDRRLDNYLLVQDLLALYVQNRNFIEGNRSNAPVFSVNVEFTYLTNNSYLAEAADAIHAPLQAPAHQIFLRKCEKLCREAHECKLIFPKQVAPFLEDFILHYIELLHTMYRYQIVLNNMTNHSNQEIQEMTLDEKIKYFHEESDRDELFKAYKNLAKSYSEIQTRCIIKKARKCMKL